MIRGGCLVALVLPFVELLLLLWAASTFGWWPVALWVLLSFAVGLGIVRLAAATSGRSFAQALRLMQQRQADTGNSNSARLIPPRRLMCARHRSPQEIAGCSSRGGLDGRLGENAET